MSSDKGSNGLSGLAASFLGGGSSFSSGTDALNASLSSDIVASTPFLLELLNMRLVELLLECNPCLLMKGSPLQRNFRMG